MRLTRRGRLVVAAALAAVPLGMYGGLATANPTTGQPTEVMIVTAAPGNTLWQYARQITPQGKDIRDTLEQIRELNALKTDSIQIGQTILLPTK